MSKKPRPTIFVLWGEAFDEIAATYWTSFYRQAGIRVKLVGVDARCAMGIHGIRIQADLTLSQALPLAPQALFVVIPCTMHKLVMTTRQPYKERISKNTNRNSSYQPTQPDAS